MVQYVSAQLTLSGCKMCDSSYHSSLAVIMNKRGREWNRSKDTWREKVINCGWWENNCCTERMRMTNEFLTGTHIISKNGKITIAVFRKILHLSLWFFDCKVTYFWLWGSLCMKPWSYYIMAESLWLPWSMTAHQFIVMLWYKELTLVWHIVSNMA